MMFPILRQWQHQGVLMTFLLLMIIKRRCVMGLPADIGEIAAGEEMAKNLGEITGAHEGTHSDVLHHLQNSDHQQDLNFDSQTRDHGKASNHEDDSSSSSHEDDDTSSLGADTAWFDGDLPSVSAGEHDQHMEEAIKNWRSVDHQQADQEINDKTNELIKLRNKLQHFQTEEKANLVRVDDIHRKASEKLIEELKRDPSLKKKLSTQEGNLKDSEDPSVQSWLDIVARVKLFKKPSEKPAFVKWLIRSFWENPRDLVMKVFGGKYYRSWAAWRYLNSMVSDKTFRSREDIQEALEIFQKLGKSRLTDNQNKLIILLKEEGIQAVEEKHKTLIAEASRLGFEENMIIPKDAREIVQRHMKYLINMVHSAHFSDDDKLELARLTIEPSPTKNIEKLEILQAKEGVSKMIYDELEKAAYIQEKLVGHHELTPDQKILLKHIYNHPESFHIVPEELSEAESNLLSEISHLYETRRRCINEQKAEVQLLKERMKNQDHFASRKAGRLAQIKTNHGDRNGPVLMDDSDIEVMEGLAQQADEESRKIKIPSTEITKSGEILVDRSKENIVVLEPKVTSQNQDVKAIEILEGLGAEGALKTEVDLIVRKLENRPFVLTKGEQDRVLYAAEEAKKNVGKEPDVELARDMLELSSKNHFFPDAFNTPGLNQKGTLQKILRGEPLSLRESVMANSLAAAYRQHIVDRMTEPELALLSVRKFKHTMQHLSEGETNALLERIERYSLGPDEYFTILMALEKKKYFTSDQWFLSFVSHAESSGTEISPELAEVKSGLENSIHLSPHLQEVLDHFNVNVKLAIVKQLEEEGSEEGRFLDEAMGIIGSAAIGTTDLERLQLISQMNAQEIRALFEHQDKYEDLDKLVKEAQRKLSLVKEYDQRMHIFSKEQQSLEEKVDAQRSLSELSFQNLEQTKHIFNEKLKSLGIDHHF
ncbi:uncharacterized protein MELLADRAFT_62059 [Melampsora larici-populina 98AG31]|uniref:Secreted protein n=1 Tax=Melampsora larici-populina (strain 98AG31 / pathotype 3-4-7) TaxID=747676 RepID=F4RH39_MELLP|nr:uncharacterized protein MELLADRAFT_62059 [Melampsora larici-populina 98AG31]EGG08233.1 hypothetical protein MELLADRAFT_62059 [Melampsora larici-populina 98AG31]